MTNQPLPGDSVSPYLRMNLRDAPTPRIQKPQERPPERDSEAAPDNGVNPTTPSRLWREVPPLARPGIKI
jgi:hypothetical protein